MTWVINVIWLPPSKDVENIETHIINKYFCKEWTCSNWSRALIKNRGDTERIIASFKLCSQLLLLNNTCVQCHIHDMPCMFHGILYVKCMIPCSSCVKCHARDVPCMFHGILHMKCIFTHYEKCGPHKQEK